MRLILGKVKQTLFCLVVWLIAHTVFICIDGLTDDAENASVAIVLGTTVHEDGTLSPRLQARLDAGLELYNRGLVESFYVSGGLGKEGHLEGTKMKEYLVSLGLDSNKVKIDNQGNNTRATAVNFRKDFPDISSVYVVSQFFHITRTKLAFSQVGVENIYGAHAEYYELRDVYSTIREFFGYYAYWWKY